MLPMKSRGNLVLVLGATLLSAFNGLLTAFSVMVFSGKESPWMWVSIYLPALLWIAAALCYKFPRSGLLSFTLLIAISLALCVGLSSHPQTGAAWAGCAYSLRFALVGGVLLVVNIFLTRATS
jgi:hypothetical protein